MIEYVYGPPGSGKSQLLNRRMVDNALKGMNIAVNFEPDENGFYRALRHFGKDKHQAVRIVDRVEIVRTFEQLRKLENIWFGFDEAHLWFNARAWSRVSLSDVAFWSQIRKGGVDITLVSQRREAIDRIVRDLATREWAARPLVTREESVFPFNVGLQIARRVFGVRWVGLSMYTNTLDAMGDTKSRRKGFAGATNSKSIIPIDPVYVQAYRTGRIFASPLIEEDAIRERRKFLASVLKGEVTPMRTCPSCRGLGDYQVVLDVREFEVIAKEVPRSLDMTSDYVYRSECPVCAGRGFFNDPQASEVDEALSAALRGELGDECRKLAEEITGTPGVSVKDRLKVKRGESSRYRSARASGE